MSVPSMTTEPRSGLSSPISVFSRTDLPVPDGPSITQISPAGTVSVTSPQMSCLPKDLVSPSILISTPMARASPFASTCPVEEGAPPVRRFQRGQRHGGAEVTGGRLVLREAPVREPPSALPRGCRPTQQLEAGLADVRADVRKGTSSARSAARVVDDGGADGHAQPRSRRYTDHRSAVAEQEEAREASTASGGVHAQSDDDRRAGPSQQPPAAALTLDASTSRCEARTTLSSSPPLGTRGSAIAKRDASTVAGPEHQRPPRTQPPDDSRRNVGTEPRGPQE